MYDEEDENRVVMQYQLCGSLYLVLYYVSTTEKYELYLENTQGNMYLLEIYDAEEEGRRHINHLISSAEDDEDLFDEEENINSSWCTNKIGTRKIETVIGYALLRALKRLIYDIKVDNDI